MADNEFDIKATLDIDQIIEGLQNLIDYLGQIPGSLSTQIDVQGLDQIEADAQSAGLDLQAVGEAASKSGISLESLNKATAETSSNTKEASTSATGLGFAFGGVKTVVGALVGIGLTSWLMQSIQKARDSADSWNKLGVVLKEHGVDLQNVKGQISNIAYTQGFLTSQVRESIRYLVQAGMSYQDVVKDNGALQAAMGVSIALNQDLDSSVRGLQRSYMGQGRQLKLLGIDVNDYKDKSTGLVNQEKLNQAILEKTGGQLAEHAKSYEAMMTRLDIATSKLQVALGNALLPIINPIIEGITNLVNAFSSLPPIFQQGTLVIGGLVGGVTALSLILAPLVSLLTPLGGILLGLGAEATTAAVGMSILEVAMGPIGWAILAITAAIAAGIYIWSQYSQQITDFINTIKSGDWAGAASAIGNSFQYVGLSIWNALQSAGQYIYSFLVNIPNYIGQASSFLVNAGTDIINWIITGLTSVANSLQDALFKMLTYAADNSAKGSKYSGGKIGNSLIDGFITWIHDNGPKMADSLVKEFTVMIPLIIQIIKLIGQIVGLYLWEAAETAGSNFINGIKQWFQQLPGTIGNFLASTANTILYWTGYMIGLAIRTGIDLVNGFIQLLPQLPGMVWNFLVQTLNQIIHFATNAPSYARQAGSNIVNGLRNSITSLPSVVYNELVQVGNTIMNAGGWLWDKASQLGQSMLDGLKKGLGIASPGYMYWAIVNELGMMDNALSNSSLIKAAKSLGNDMVSAFDLSNMVNIPDISGLNLQQMQTTTTKQVIEQNLNVTIDLQNAPPGITNNDVSSLVLNVLDTPEGRAKLDSAFGKTASDFKKNNG